MQFFRTTGLCFAQTMPMVWRVLIVLNQIKNLHFPDLCIEDISIAYRLRSHGSSWFLLFSTYMNFREVTPPIEDSERRIKAIYRLPEGDRIFSTHLLSSSQY
ncbi:hypothetical protein Hanom_Chr02g00156891 [Helianthus anomalus]